MFMSQRGTRPSVWRPRGYLGGDGAALTNGRWAALQPLLPCGRKPGRPPKWTRTAVAQTSWRGSVSVDAQRRVGWSRRPRRGHQVHDGGADCTVDHRQDLLLGPPGPVVPLGERAHPGSPDLGRGYRRQPPEGSAGHGRPTARRTRRPPPGRRPRTTPPAPGRRPDRTRRREPGCHPRRRSPAGGRRRPCSPATRRPAPGRPPARPALPPAPPAARSVGPGSAPRSAAASAAAAPAATSPVRVRRYPCGRPLLRAACSAQPAASRRAAPCPFS